MKDIVWASAARRAYRFGQTQLVLVDRDADLDAKDEGVSLSSLLARGLQHELDARARLEADDPSAETTSKAAAKWWRRGKTETERAQLLRTLVVEPLSAHVARLAGTAVGVVGAGVADAIVMASASVRGGLVYTTDPDDLERLTEVFGDVHVVAV